MSKYLTNKVKVLKTTDAIFASAVETDKIALDNYQSVRVVVESGEGTAVKTNAKVIAIIDENNTKEIKTQEITIGDNTTEYIDVVADEIAEVDATEIKITIDAVAESEITGTIVAVLGEERYTE